MSYPSPVSSFSVSQISCSFTFSSVSTSIWKLDKLLEVGDFLPDTYNSDDPSVIFSFFLQAWVVKKLMPKIDFESWTLFCFIHLLLSFLLLALFCLKKQSGECLQSSPTFTHIKNLVLSKMPALLTKEAQIIITCLLVLISWSQPTTSNRSPSPSPPLLALIGLIVLFKLVSPYPGLLHSISVQPWENSLS